MLNKSILVVDEDPEVLGFLTMLFEARDIRVLRARSGSEAAQVLSRPYVPVDLIVANIMLPDTGRLAYLRPGVSLLYMSAFIDSGVIRIVPTGDDRGLLEAALSSLARPRTLAIGR